MRTASARTAYGSRARVPISTRASFTRRWWERSRSVHSAAPDAVVESRAMAVETAVRTEPASDEAPARRRWGVGDYVFLAVFVLFTVGSVIVLGQGLGA